MIIRCYGARGSLPVSGAEYVKFGGDTACLEIRSKNDEIIIVDAGTGMRRLGNRLLSEGRFEYNVIISHSHMDHIMGFPFFKPIYDERTSINLLGCPTAQGSLRKILSKAMAPPFFPIPFDTLTAKINYSGDCQFSFIIDSIEIFPINLSHPSGGMGYKFVEDGKKFVFLTDNELGYRHREGPNLEDFTEFARDADLLIHDAEYTPQEYETARTWGHSTYSDALNLALRARVKKLGLFHHKEDRTDAEQENIVQSCRAIVRREKIEMECFALFQTVELVL